MSSEHARAMQDLGATNEDVNRCLQAQTYEQACAQLQALKDRAKSRKKKLAFDWHPDRTGGDKGLAERLRALLEVFDELMKLKIMKPQPRPMPMITVSFGGFGGTSTTTNSSVTNTTGWNW